MATASSIAPAPVIPGRITAAALSKILLEPSESGKVAVIDVRGEDHIGGHILSSMHVPSDTLDHAIPSLTRKLADKEIVIFHCALSQVRGPKAAAQYMRERDRLLGPQGAGRGEVGKTLVKNKVQNEATEGGASKDGEWVDEETVDEKDEKSKLREQKVYVLDRGFEGWQEVYGKDERLTENWSEELWQSSESDDPINLGSTPDSRTADREEPPSPAVLRSLESSHPLIPTDTSAAAETIPTRPAMHARKQPSVISSHIGIFLSSIVGICACLIFFYWLHGCFKIGGPARPRALTRSSSASPRPGILSRIRRYWSDARAEGRRKLATKGAKKAKERPGPCGCHWQARRPENVLPVRDAGPATELRNYSALGGIGRPDMPQPVLGGAHIREPSYHWDPTLPRLYSPYQPVDASVQTVDIASQDRVVQPSIFSGLTMPARSFTGSGRRWMGTRLDEDSYFMDRPRDYFPAQLEEGLFADDGLRTPPPRYDEMYIDGSRRAF
ncbi:hypothetical protein V493_06236 [Pseudogymnoascus sp. VKM F-4281 (FW-2241)]|nr:hypothetical protein V493_06236 [Pseudogymnoascus sp. VKM F-4281 (FW-2241)]